MKRALKSAQIRSLASTFPGTSSPAGIVARRNATRELWGPGSEIAGRASYIGSGPSSGPSGCAEGIIKISKGVPERINSFHSISCRIPLSAPIPVQLPYLLALTTPCQAHSSSSSTMNKMETSTTVNWSLLLSSPYLSLHRFNFPIGNVQP